MILWLSRRMFEIVSGKAWRHRVGCMLEEWVGLFLSVGLAGEIGYQSSACMESRLFQEGGVQTFHQDVMTVWQKVKDSQ